MIPSIFSDHNAVRLDLNYRRKTIKNSNIRRLNNTLLNNQQITEEIKKEITICIETNENEKITTQNLWDTVKAVIRGKFIAIQAHLKKEILKIRAEINAKGNKRDHSKKQQRQKLVLERINKIDKPLARLVKKQW